MTSKPSWWASPSLWLIAIVLFAGAVRLVHIEWDQSHFFHPDERAVAYAVERLSFKPLKLDPDFFAYGSLPIYLAKVATSVASAIDPRGAGYDGAIINGRRLSALLGAATVLVLILLGVRLYDRSVALLAGLLLAACPLHVQNSRFLTVDVPLAFFVLLALTQLMRVIKQGRAQQFVLAGICIGLAVGTKFSAMPLFLPLSIAALYRYRVERRLLAIAGRFLLAVVAAAAAFVLVEPFAILHHDRFLHDILEQSHMVRNAGVYPYTTQYMGTPKYWYDLSQMVVWGMAPLLGIVAVWATLTRLGIAWRQRRAEEWVLLSWVLPFFLITGWFEVKFPRYLLPIYPIMILWAAEWLVRQYRSGRLLGRLAAPIVVAGTLAATAAFVSTYTRPHTVVTASEWAYSHIPNGTKVLSQDWDEGFPFPLPGHNPAQFKVVTFGYYEPDSSTKIQRLSQELASADYIAFQTKRLYGAITQGAPYAGEKYKLTNNYFYELFAGDLGFTLVYEAASRPSLFGIEFPDEIADESLTVYDHPKVLIFKKTEQLDAAVISDKILHGLPSRPLTRKDLLLAKPTGTSIEASGAAPPIHSSMVALILFAALIEILSLAALPLLWQWIPGLGTVALSKTIGVLLFAYVSWLLISLGAASFTQGNLMAIAAALLLCGALVWRRRTHVALGRPEIVHSELLFWGVFVFFLCVRMFNPEVYWGEKPMDFSFLNSMTRATTLPPPEPWFAGSPLQYNYFGHYTIAALGKTLHLDPALTFNLGIALIAGLTAASAYAVGCAVGGQWQTGLLAAFFVTLIGNLAGVREWAARHTASFHDVVDVSTFLRWAENSRQTFGFDYFWATSRVIKDTINEFPFWSFLFADLHAHVMVMPLSLTFVCLSVLWVRSRVLRPEASEPTASKPVLFALLCLTLGAITVTNTWSAPTYVLFFVFLLGTIWLSEGEYHGVLRFCWGVITRVIVPSAIVIAVSVALFTPFWRHFTPPERNFGWERLTPDKLALPHDFLTIFGLFVFVLVPFLFVLWTRTLRGERERLRWNGYVLVALAFAVMLASLAVSTRAFSAILFLLGLQVLVAYTTETRWRIPVAMATFAFAITAGCDLVYTWDRMNTIFKFYLEAWLLLAVAAAVAARALWTGAVALPRLRRVWQMALAALVVLGLFTATTDTYGVIRTNRVQTPKPTLDGMAYLHQKAPYEMAAYEWMNSHIEGIPILLEAHGDSYQEYTRVSMNTGLPTVLGWGYHVFQRGHTWPEINRRKADIETVYTTDLKDKAAQLLQRYQVALVFVGALERRVYAGANLERFEQWTDLLTPIYRNPGVTIFAVNGRFSGSMPVSAIEEIPPLPAEEAAAPPQDAPGKLAQPRGVALAPDGSIVTCDFGNNRIQEFGPDLKFLRQWGRRGELTGEFKDPCGIATAPNGEIFVADTWNHRVQVFAPDGKFLREWALGFYGPRGIAVDSKGSVFLADTGNNRIVRFSAAGAKEIDWGGKGPEPGHFFEPVGVAVDSAGKVYVCDNGNGRLQIFTRDGQFVSTFAVPGWESKVYSEPYVALDPNGTIWVTVPGAKEVRNYDSTGKLLRAITGKSIPGVAFETPMGITLNAAKHELIIADLEHRIVRIPVN